MSILKIVLKNGHKSNALRLLGVFMAAIASIGIVAYFINASTEQTNKVSFKAAGVKYREQYTAADIISLPDTYIEEKQTAEKYEQKILKKVFVNGTEFFMSVKNKKSTNLSLKRVEKQPVATANMEISSDLQVLSSFDCVKSIPKILLDYISNMFLIEYGKSHEDFHSQYTIDETLPLLKHFSINCDTDQNCSALFQYDKYHGLKTTTDKTYRRKEVFYCCPSVHSSTNETLSDVCQRAQTIVGKSVFRESKDSTFLGRVKERDTYAQLD